MTENELKINGRPFSKTISQLEEYMRLDSIHGELFAVLQSARDFMENLNEEIQQYRAIGTVEEIQKKMEELERWHTDRINENIKNPFAYTSTSICHNCDHKDEYIEELETEVTEYKSIGTIEEFKALKEKNTPKKPFGGMYDWTCPTCGTYHSTHGKCCSECMQMILWD